MYKLIIGDDVLDDGAQAILIDNITCDELKTLIEIMIPKGMEICIKDSKK